MVYVLKFSVNNFMAENAKKSYTYDNMMPLSTENESVGSPEMFHCLIFTGSPRVAIREKSSEQWIPLSFTLLIQISVWSCKKQYFCVFLFDFILYVPSTIFQLYRDGIFFFVCEKYQTKNKQAPIYSIP